MKRVSLGIILNGDPNCVQKNRVPLKIFEILCLYGWIPMGIAAVIFILVSFPENSVRKLYVGLGFVFCSILFFLCSYIWGEKVRCSYCKHFLTLKRISEDQFLDSSERTISQRVYDGGSGVILDSYGDSAYYTTLSSHKEYGKEVTKRYTYNLRCSCCGSVCKVEKSKTSQHY